MGYIFDLSHHQPPSSINYDKLAAQADLVIIRTQYGSATIDKYYKTHYAEFLKRNVPTAAYAWVRGTSISDMEKEATDFYNRTKQFNPSFWWLDVEEKSMSDMRNGVSAYINKLRQLGAKKVGIYVANNLYKSFNLKVEEADAIWIPSYGVNNGKQNRKPDFPCHLWQYTSVGRLDGYSSSLDLSVLVGDKPLSFFTGVEEPVFKKEEEEMLDKAIVINGFADFASAEPLANRLQAPIFTRASLSNRKVSKELYVVGGTVDGLQADNIIPLTGADRYEVAASVKKFLG